MDKLVRNFYRLLTGLSCVSMVAAFLIVMLGVLFHVWQENPLALCFASHHESATGSLLLQLQLQLLLHLR